MKETIQVVIEDKVFNLSPMKVRKVGELERKLLKALAPLLAGMGGLLPLFPDLLEKGANSPLLSDALALVDLNRLAMGVQDALASLPDHEFDALLVGMCSSVSTHIEGKGNSTLVTGELIDSALESSSQMYRLMYEVARYNKFLPFGIVGIGDAIPATVG